MGFRKNVLKRKGAIPGMREIDDEDYPEWPERKSIDGGRGSVTRIPKDKIDAYSKDVMKRGNDAAKRLASKKYRKEAGPVGPQKVSKPKPQRTIHTHGPDQDTRDYDQDDYEADPFNYGMNDSVNIPRLSDIIEKSGTLTTFNPDGSIKSVEPQKKSQLDKERERNQNKYGAGYDAEKAHQAQQRDKTRRSATGGKTFKNKR